MNCIYLRKGGAIRIAIACILRIAIACILIPRIPMGLQIDVSIMRY